MKLSEKQSDPIDRLFKNKLEEHHLEPAENTWTKVEAGLSKKNNTWAWRWAAVFLLTGALLALTYQWQKDKENNSALAEKKNERLSPQNNPNKNTTTKKLSVDEAKSNLKTANTETGKTGEHAVPSTAGKSRLLPAQGVALNQAVQTSEAKPEAENSGLIKTDEKEKNMPEATPVVQTASTRQKPIKLEFTLEDFSPEQTVATVAGEKKSGLKKILDLARDMKQGEGPVSNLREIKNEIFAHNFIAKKKDN